MTPTVIIVAIALVAAGGLIAYIGDTIGKRLGRRRATLFGLRPRWTAILVSTTTGVLIALMSLGILLTFSGRVREALTRYDALKSDIDQAQKDLSAAKQAVAAARQSAVRAREQRDDALSARREAEGALAKTENELGAATENLSEREGQLRSAEGELKRKRIELSASQAAASSLAYGVKYELFDSRPVTFPRGDELARTTLTAGLSKAEIRSALEKLKLAADQAAKAGGARAYEELDPESRVVVFAAEEDANSTEGKRVLTPNHAARDAYYNKAADEIAAALKTADRLVVRVVSVGAAVQGRPVLVVFAGDAVQRVFRADETIVKAQISAALSYDDIVGELQELGADLRNAALERGMIPPPGGRFGSLRPSQIDRLVHQIQGSRTTVTVAVRAARDLLNTDELEVRFEVVS